MEFRQHYTNFSIKIRSKIPCEDVDYRIHFSLNCPGKSCPPVGAYDAKNLDEQWMRLQKNICAKTVHLQQDKKFSCPSTNELV
jgi:hypothetical protein